jgi:hypothetical protein
VKKIPPHIVEVYGSARKFRASHRKGLRDVMKAMGEARRGAFYSPAFPDIEIAMAALERAINATRAKVWDKSSGSGGG